MKSCLAIMDMIERFPALDKKRRGLPETGVRNDGLDFFSDVKIIDDAFKYSNSLYALEDKIDKRLTLYNAGAGSPMRTKPFPLAVRAIVECIEDDEWSQYQIAAGDINCRKTIAEFLNKNNFYSGRGIGTINEDNIIFTDSTTEAFYLLLQVIVRPYDVILFTGPTYGLFTYIPERLGAISRIMPLAEADSWFVNPRTLEEYISSINNEMINFAKKNNLSYTPRVVAFLNINPHNPTGKVMGINQKSLLEQIALICKQKGAFVIDDIIYKELCYDQNNIALPMGTLPNMDGNIITLMGVSKSYGLAAARAGMIVADERIIRGIRNKIFQQMDSTPLYLGKILQAVFCNSKERDAVYCSYFNKVRNDYIRKWKLMHALVIGIDYFNVDDKGWILDVVKEVCGDKARYVLQPIPQIRIAGNIIPESGFFVLLDFSASKGMHYKDVYIQTERDILYYYYVYAYVKLLMGKSIGWPGKEFVARVSFAFEDRDIVLMMKQMKDAANQLEC